MTPDREVPIGALLARGIQEQEANHITGNKPTVLWHELARIDGGLALSVLTEAEFDLIRQELGRAGIPAHETITRQEVFNFVVTVGENDCPPKGTPWYNQELHASVACGVLLRLVAEAWSFDAEAEKQKRVENFGKLLGVATSVEAV
jgi:hypothetical protein